MSEKEIIVIPPTKSTIKTNKKIKLKVAAYARVSSEKDEQLNSLESQRVHYETYIKSISEWIFVGIYYDEGISGLNTKKRDGFNRMINDALAGKIDLILTKSISRFARNVLDTVSVTRKLKNAGIGVIFEKENINSLDSTSDFILTILAAAAEEESKQISSNVKWGKRRSFKEGRFSVAYASFLGYKKGKNQCEMVIDKDQAPIVKLIYKLYLEKNSTYFIACYLNKLGIPSPMGKLWSKHVIVSILSNEKYIGDALLQKRFVYDIFTHRSKKNEGEIKRYYIKNSHEPIIPREVYNEVQIRLKKHDLTFSCKKRYSSLLKCKLCGSSYMVVHYYYKSKKFYITRWICSNRLKKVKCKNIVLYDDELNYMTDILYLFLYKKYPSIKSDVDALLTEYNILHQELSLPENKQIKDITFRVITEGAVVNHNRSVDIKLIDKSIFHYKLPLWSPVSGGLR